MTRGAVAPRAGVSFPNGISCRWRNDDRRGAVPGVAPSMTTCARDAASPLAGSI
jgi:hypothetical protein